MPRRKMSDGQGETPAQLIDAIVADLRPKDGSESPLLDGRVASATEYISTQSLALDVALNMPGIPQGRLTVIRGWESSGKTTLITHLLAETQRIGGVAVLLDSEFAFDEDRAARIGLNRDEMVIAQPETLEDSIALIEKTIKAVRNQTPDKPVVIVWDSVGGTPTKAGLEGEFGDSKAFGLHAKLVSEALRRITGKIKKENITLVIVNQNRELVETGPFAGTGNETSTMIAKRPLQFHASVIIDVRKGSELRLDKTDANSPSYGITTRMKVVKNKCSNPFGKAEVRCLFDSGFDDDYGHFQLALKIGMITAKGSWYKMPDIDDNSFHAADFGEVLADNEGLRERIALAVRKELWQPSVRQKFLSKEEES